MSGNNDDDDVAPLVAMGHASNGVGTTNEVRRSGARSRWRHSSANEITLNLNFFKLEKRPTRSRKEDDDGTNANRSASQELDPSSSGAAVLYVYQLTEL